MTTQRFSRRYWINLARLAGVLALLGLVAIGARLFQMAGQLAQDSLHPPRNPLTRTPADIGIANYQDVSFVTSDGLTIRGWLIPGSNGALIVLGHGNQDNRAGMLGEAAILSAKGYGVLMFDWRGEGESGGDMVSFGQFEVRDLRAAVDYVTTLPGVDPAEPGTTGTSLYPASSRADPGRIGGLGFSLGASAMALGAAQDDRLRAVIIEDSFATLDEVASYRTRGLPLVGALAMKIGQSRAGVDANLVKPVDAICRISPRPVLLIYGAQDDYIPPDSADRMFAAACQPKELWRVPGVGHGGFANAVPEEYAARITAFFDQNLLK